MCALATTILCEDMNYTDIFPHDGVFQHSCCKAYNPGLQVDNYGFKPQWGGQSFVTLASVGMVGKDGGSMPSGSQPDHVLRMASFSTPPGGVWLTLRNNAALNYMSGHTNAQANVLYVRVQAMFSTDFTWPGGTRTSTVGKSVPSECYDTKILYVWPPGAEDSPTDGHYDAGLHTQCGVADTSGSGPGGANVWFSDALAVRYGNIDFPNDCPTGNPYKFLPLCAECQNFCTGDPGYNSRFNFQTGYAPFPNLTLVDPNQTVEPGRPWRFTRGVWYTLELMYQISSADDVADGAIKTWVNGTLLYDEAAIYTCGQGTLGACAGIGEMSLQPYHNGLDNTPWTGYMYMDNLVVSTAPIGVPGAAAPAQQKWNLFLNLRRTAGVLLYVGALVAVLMVSVKYAELIPKQRRAA